MCFVKKNFLAKRPIKNKHLDLFIKYPGLGDNLFFSHIPRLAKNAGYKTVSVHVPCEIYGTEKSKLIWDLNPFVDRVKPNHGNHEMSLVVRENIPLLDSIAIDLGLVDQIHNFEPEVFYKPKKDFSGLTIYDGNYISGAGLISGNKLKARLSAEPKIYYLKPLSRRYIPSLSLKHQVISVNTLEEYFDLVATAERFLCVVSGGASLRPAFGKRATVFYGVGQYEWHRHSRLNEFIDLSPRIAIGLKIFSKLVYKTIRMTRQLILR